LFTKQSMMMMQG